MGNNLDLSVILPIRSAVVKDFDTFYDAAISSIKNQSVGIKELIIVHTTEELLVKKIKDHDYGDINVVFLEHPGEGSYGEQINSGIIKAQGKWISFFEFDDEYSSIWFKNVKKYVDLYPNVNGFLPIVLDVNSLSVFAGFTNEVTFANNFAMEVGILTNELLHKYQNFQTSGMVLDREMVMEFGMFKPNMRLTYGYEFLLRMTYNSMKIMTIPKIGYKHMNLREGSIFWNYKNGEDGITEDEAKFWVKTAQREYFFNKDRNIKYEKEMV